MNDLVTISPDQLPELGEIPDDLRALVFSPSGPLQAVPHGRLLSKLIATNLCKATKAALDADLAHAADSVALVFADPTAASNGWYRKTGASGAGAWTQFEELARNSRVLAAAAAELAGLYANADTDADIPGGAAGERGARFWAAKALADGAAQVALAAAQADRAENAVESLSVTLTTGRPVITGGTGASNAGVYIYLNPEPVTRNIDKIRVKRAAGSPIVISVAEYSFAGGQFTRTSAPVDVTVPAGATSEIVLPSLLKVRRGYHLGHSIPGSGSVGVSFSVGTTGDNGGYFYHNVPGAVGPFTPSGGATDQIRLEIGFDGFYAEAVDDLTAVLQPQIDDNADAIAANTTATALNAVAISDVTEQQAYVAISRVRTGSAYSAFPTGSPSSKSWAVGFLGTELPAGAPIGPLAVTVHRGAGIETFEARLRARPIATTSVPSGADAVLWSEWVSVGAAGIATGSFGDVSFTPPVTTLADPSLAYYLELRAKNSGGTIVDMGVGRAFDADVGLNPVQRGFYRDAADAFWVGLSATASLNIRVSSSRRAIKQSALPVAVDRKKRAAMLLWGRTLLVFNNSTPKTYRRSFAVPANATRLVQVVFAHGGLASIPITAAVAPIASAANYAASGANWTRLRFSGSESGTIPAARGSLRLGMLASDQAAIPLLDRTDVAGAAKIIMVSAYCSTAGNLTLLGSATDNDNYRTNWESRSDFPSIMRRNDGDCVTNPGNFTSTTNEKSGTMIAGIVVECDNGELLSIGAVGDSNTHGAGIQVSGDNMFGLGWVEKMAFSMSTAERGVMPIMLGWSGLTMPQISNIANDFYDFVAASGIPAPHMMYAPNASINSMNAPLTAAQMDAQLPLATGIRLRVSGAGGIPITWTVWPVNPSVKDFNSTDSFRRAYNDFWRARGNAQSGYIVADFDAAMAGVLDVDGQVNIAVGLTADNIHANAAGYDALFPVGVRATRPALPALGYAVGGLVT